MRVTVARRGDDHPGADFDVHVRIPALAAMPWGLVLAYDVRPSALDLPGPHGIAYRMSGDMGATWSKASWLTEPGPVGTGDASLISTDKELLCFYVASIGKSFWDDTDPSAWGLRLARTSDGLHWTHEDLTEALWPEDAGSLFASSGNGTQLLTGRILQPLVVRRRATQERYAVMAISDDGGTSWRLGSPIEGCDETKVVEADSGVVVLHSRSTPHRLLAFSDDGGQTFTEPVSDIEEPGCNGGLAYLKGRGLVATTIDPRYAHAGGTMVDPTGGRGTESGPDWSQRRGLVLRSASLPGHERHANRGAGSATARNFSPARSLAWGKPLVLDNGQAAYSVAIALPGGIAVAWEHGTYETIEYAFIPAETIPL